MSALVGDRRLAGLGFLGYCQPLPPIPTIADMCHTLGRTPKGGFLNINFKGIAGCQQCVS